jgi:hypothetical protein
MVGMPESKPPKPRRIKVREVKQEVQTGEAFDETFAHES